MDSSDPARYDDDDDILHSFFASPHCPSSLFNDAPPPTFDSAVAAPPSHPQYTDPGNQLTTMPLKETEAMMNSLNPTQNLQYPATFEEDDDIFRQLLSSILDDAPPPPNSDSAVVGFQDQYVVDPGNQITTMPFSHHNLNQAVDRSVHGLYNGFSTDQPQGSEGGLMNQWQTQSQSQFTDSTIVATAAAEEPPTKPKVRARRGQATDPHSIAERLRRERIAQGLKSLRQLVPHSNKRDKATMLDEITDYVKFLQLQVKVLLSASTLEGAATVSPQISEDIYGANENISTSAENQTETNLTEQQAAKLMEEDMGSAIQYLQGKGLCLIPISLANTISTAVKDAGAPLSTNLSVQSTNTATNGVTENDELSFPSRETAP